MLLRSPVSGSRSGIRNQCWRVYVHQKDDPHIDQWIPHDKEWIMGLGDRITPAAAPYMRPVAPVSPLAIQSFLPVCSAVRKDTYH